MLSLCSQLITAGISQQPPNNTDTLFFFFFKQRSSSSAVDQCLDPQLTYCQELGGAAQVFFFFFFFFFFFCGRSAVPRPSVHMLPGTGWCGAGLPRFLTAWWWLAHPAAITGVSVATRSNSPGGCGGPSALLL